MLWIVNILAFVINAVFVGVSGGGLLGETNATVSDENMTLVTPEGWAFRIWILIFVTEAIFVIYQALPSKRQTEIIAEGVWYWFAIACILQAVWSVIFAQELLVASAVIILLLAFSLAMAVVGLARFKRSDRCGSLSFVAVHFPIGLHGGWVLAASLVNINVALDEPSVSTKVTALILTLVGACVGATIAAAIFHDQVYLLSIAWALAAIADKQAERNAVLGEAIAAGVNEAIRGLWIALLVVGLLTAIATTKKAYDHSQPTGQHRNRVHGHRRGHQSDLTGVICNP